MSIRVGTRTFVSVEDLEKLVVHAATEYELNGYVEDFDGLEVTDPEYDQLVRTLRQLNPDAKCLKGTSPSQVRTKGGVVIHSPPMTSIAKADGAPEEKKALYERWLADIAKRNGNKKPEIAQEYKRDGAAVRINYVKGKLVSAGQRPRDGVHGNDITRHMQYVRGVPAKLSLPLTLSLNGEIECSLTDFEAVNQEVQAAGRDPFKNPRNYVAGCLGRDDPEENKHARLRISFYSITGFDNWQDHYHTEIERAKWANSKHGLNLQGPDGKGYFVRAILHTKYEQLEMMEQNAKGLPYYTDGVVLKVNDLELFEDMGNTGDDLTGDPRGALAWKYEEEKAEATVSRIEWNATRTGRVVPTAIFDIPFVLADTSNSRATCNNIGWMESNGLGPGAVAICKKGGKIIPNICGVKKPVKNVGAPTACPACNAKLVLKTSTSGNRDLTCPNSDCGAKHINSWIHYFQKMGAKGLGDAAMEQILRSGKVRTLADFYRLTEADLISMGFSKRQALLGLAAIWLVSPKDNDDKLAADIERARKKKLKIQGWIFFQCLGIPGAGETAGKTLIKHFQDFDKIRIASTDELLEVNGIGQTTAEAIHSWFDQEGYVLVEELLDYIELELPKIGKFTGKNFVLTGDFSKGKKFWKDAIESAGGNCQSSVGKTTNYLVRESGTGGGPSEKEQKAQKLGIPVISPDDLEKMLV